MASIDFTAIAAHIASISEARFEIANELEGLRREREDLQSNALALEEIDGHFAAVANSLRQIARPSLLESIVKVLDGRLWPANACGPEEVDRRLKVIDGRIAEAQTQETELLRLMGAAGL